MFPALSSGDNRNSRGVRAWELTARFACLDFVDGDTLPETVGQAVGVRLPQATFGTNWYLADWLRLMFDYTYAAPSEANLGGSNASMFGMRLAMFW